MAAPTPSRIRLSPEDKHALTAYWQFYEPIAAEVGEELRHALAELPEWRELLRNLPQDTTEQDRRSLALQREALVEGNWLPYIEDLYAQGAQYANMGVTFLAWYDVIALFRDSIRRRLAALARVDLERAQVVVEGMNRLFDIAMGHLGEAYLAAKERIIREQQVALRRISLPILQVGEGLLVAPLVGTIEDARARQLIEDLLNAIRDRRAHAVVLDVTGVPDVDSGIARNLVQTCAAARLMGARVVISGVSPPIARALALMGARLPGVELVGDLQEAIEAIRSPVAPPPAARAT